MLMTARISLMRGEMRRFVKSPKCSPRSPSRVQLISFAFQKTTGVLRFKKCESTHQPHPSTATFKSNIQNSTPVSAGTILNNGSIFIHRDAGDYSTPIDSQCRAACDANPDFRFVLFFKYACARFGKYFRFESLDTPFLAE